MIITLAELLTEIALTAVCASLGGFIAGYVTAAIHLNHHKKGSP